MSPFRRLILTLGLIGVPLVGISFWLAGLWGGLIAFLVVAAGLLRFAGFLGFTTFSQSTLQLATTIMVVGVAAIALVGGVDYYQQEQKREGDAKRERQAQTRVLPPLEMREFKLRTDRESFVLLTGQGLFHRVEANKPFLVVTGPDGATKEFRRPAGESTIRGQDPPGFLTLKAIEPDTVVRIATEKQ